MRTHNHQEWLLQRLRLNTKGFTPFEHENYQYILGQNGLFLAKENAAFTAIVPVDKRSLSLEPVETHMTLKQHIKLRAAVIYPAITFFRAVYELHGTEALLLILLDPDTGAVSLGCPAQENSVAHVAAADDEEIPANLLRVGDIHSHPCHSFHSDGDRRDEEHRDGLHIVVGNLDQAIPDFTASLVVNGHREELDPAEVMELHFSFPEEWLQKLNIRGAGR